MDTPSKIEPEIVKLLDDAKRLGHNPVVYPPRKKTKA